MDANAFDENLLSLAGCARLSLLLGDGSKALSDVLANELSHPTSILRYRLVCITSFSTDTGEGGRQ